MIWKVDDELFYSLWDIPVERGMKIYFNIILGQEDRRIVAIVKDISYFVKKFNFPEGERQIVEHCKKIVELEIPNHKDFFKKAYHKNLYFEMTNGKLEDYD